MAATKEKEAKSKQTSEKDDGTTLKDGVEFAECFSTRNRKNLRVKEETETDPALLEEQAG